MYGHPDGKVTFDDFLLLMRQGGVETAFQAEIREVRTLFYKFDKEEKGQVGRTRKPERVCVLFIG